MANVKSFCVIVLGVVLAIGFGLVWDDHRMSDTSFYFVFVCIGLLVWVTARFRMKPIPPDVLRRRFAKEFKHKRMRVTEYEVKRSMFVTAPDFDILCLFELADGKTFVLNAGLLNIRFQAEAYATCFGLVPRRDYSGLFPNTHFAVRRWLDSGKVVDVLCWGDPVPVIRVQAKLPVSELLGYRPVDEDIISDRSFDDLVSLLSNEVKT